MVNNNIIVINGDTYFNIDLDEMMKTHIINDNDITVSYEKNRIKIEEVIKLIQNEGIKILDISTSDADLEDVFLGLIKN